MRIAVARLIPESGLALLREAAEVNVWPVQIPPNQDELVDLARGCDGVLSLLTDRVDGSLLDRLPTVKVVSNLAVGYDNIDVAACTVRGVAVCTTPDVLTDTTADYAFALLLAASRLVVDGAISVRNGQWRVWEPLGFLGRDVAGATLGIVGFGRIGAAVARRAHGFGMRILYSGGDPSQDLRKSLGAQAADLDHLLHESDFVSLHVPLNETTRHMIGQRELELMKPTAILINTARGPVVDTDALADALEQRQILSAALDVTDPEPIPADHRLVTLPNALITPHIASATDTTRSRMSELAARNLIAVLRGETPPRCLNPEVLKYGSR